MPEQPSKQSQPKGVSSTRKLVSAVILIVLLAVAGVELRASLGQRWSTSALQPYSETNAEPVTFEEARQQLALFPSQSVVEQGERFVEYKYNWFSLLRPNQLNLYVRTDTSDPPMFIGSSTDEDSTLTTPEPGEFVSDTDDEMHAGFDDGGGSGAAAPGAEAAPAGGGGGGGRGPAGHGGPAAGAEPASTDDDSAAAQDADAQDADESPASES